MKIRSNYSEGKLLFEWNPDENVICIVQKGVFYRVKLIQQGQKGRYKILEKTPKETCYKS